MGTRRFGDVSGAVVSAKQMTSAFAGTGILVRAPADFCSQAMTSANQMSDKARLPCSSSMLCLEVVRLRPLDVGRDDYYVAVCVFFVIFFYSEAFALQLLNDLKG